MSDFCAICNGPGATGLCEKCGRQVCDSCGSIFLDVRAGTEKIRCVKCGGFYSECVDLEP